MNDATTKFTTIKVEDAETLALIGEIRGLRKEARATQEALEQRYADEAKALDDAFAKRHTALWDQLYAKAGIDPEGGYTLDTEYLDDHGIAFIKRDEQCGCGADHGMEGGPGAALARLLGGALGGNVQIVGMDMASEEEPEPTLN